MGQNPTSGLLPVKRRKEIYALCSKFDIVIIEDDPYWYLQYPSAQSTPIPPPAKSSGFPFLDSLIPSYLSVDVDGRVVRLDTFSKTVAPGCRLGWITAQPNVVERIMRITETSTQQPSGFVQSMIAELLIGPQTRPKDQTMSTGWDMTGWVRWLEGLRGEYERRMNTMCDVLEEGSKLVDTSASKQKEQEVQDAYEWSLIKNTPSGASSSTRSHYGGTISIRMKPKPTHSCPTCHSPLPPSSTSNPSYFPTLVDRTADAWSLLTTTTLFSFVRPAAGMFVWIRMQYSTHPLATIIPGSRLASALWIYLTTKPYLVLVSPGQIFSPTPEIAEESGWSFFRLCFAAIPKDQLKDISERFVSGVRAFWEITDENVIDKLAGELEGEDMSEIGREGVVALTGFC
jgi:DNA-binding transcriptional MocR family regulator